MSTVKDQDLIAKVFDFIEDMKTCKTREDLSKIADKYFNYVDKMRSAVQGDKILLTMFQEAGLKGYKMHKQFADEEKAEQERKEIAEGRWKCDCCNNMNPKREPFCRRCSASKKESK